MTSPATNDHSPVTEPTVGVATPVMTSCGALNVSGVDYDVDPKLWTVRFIFILSLDEEC